VLSVVIVAVFFLMFEVWFKVPLYKGSLDPLRLSSATDSNHGRLGALVPRLRDILTPMNIGLMFVGHHLGLLIAGAARPRRRQRRGDPCFRSPFTMPPTSAIVMLSCIFWGALVLRRHHLDPVQHPGEPCVGGATFDGYPLPRKARPARP
jgi:TctA family transporter